MACLTPIYAAVMLAASQVSPPEDRWIPGASPLETITDPCDPSIKAEDGVSLSWMRAMMIQRGHSRELVCGPATDLPPEVVAAANVDLLDLWAQATGRALVLVGSISRPLDDDASWGERSEAGGRALYLHLKADDYRALRELQHSELGPRPGPQ